MVNSSCSPIPRAPGRLVPLAFHAQQQQLPSTASYSLAPGRPIVYFAGFPAASVAVCMGRSLSLLLCLSRRPLPVRRNSCKGLCLYSRRFQSVDVQPLPSPSNHTTVTAVYCSRSSATSWSCLFQQPTWFIYSYSYNQLNIRMSFLYNQAMQQLIFV
jgi:hypothetical protein